MITNEQISVVTDTDSYKLGHFQQYPENTTAMSSYFESRGGTHPATVFFGLQYLLKRYLKTRVTMEDVGYMDEFAKRHGLSFNYLGWKRIAKDLGGKLPVEIRAVPEGSVIPVKNILMDITSTDPESFWVVNWLETLLSRLWYPITVATNSYYGRGMIRSFLEETSDGNPDSDVLFKLHDFGSRGVTCQEQAAIGGASHLVACRGTDTLAGIELLRRFYYADMPGYSIEASEHSTMTMRGRDGEVESYRNMIHKYGNNPIFACVSDSYDIFRACSEIWGGVLKQDVIDMNAMLVVRPDSGDPVQTTLRVIRILDEKFGSVENSKGYRVLNNVRVIWGDGITMSDARSLFVSLKFAGYSADNLALGMGGGLLQRVNRDNQEFAFKTSWAMVDGKEVDVYKQPVTDTKKNSKRGRLDLIEVIPGEISTTKLGRFVDTPSLLQPVFLNGEILKTVTFDEVRNNLDTKVFQVYKGWKDYVEPWE